MAKLTTAQQKELNALLQQNSLMQAVNKLLRKKGHGHFEVVALKIQPVSAVPSQADQPPIVMAGDCPDGYEMQEKTNANGSVTKRCVKKTS